MSVVQQAITILQSEYNFKFPWICRRCTYINDDRIDECCLCRYVNPQYDSNVATEVLQRARSLLEQSQLPNYGDKFRNTFKKWPVLLPVIHVKTREQALRNAKKAFNAGCDGVWLIYHGGRFEGIRPEQALAQCYNEVRNYFPEKWIGVNVLSFTNQPFNIFSWVKDNCPNCNGIWTDNVFATSPEVMRRFSMIKEEVGWDGLLFGGVAFKYQEKIHPLQDAEEPPVEAIQSLKRITQQALPFVDVITTSGTTTGGIPSIKKVEAMHSVACPLAISGCGMDFDNFKGCGDAFLAATAFSVDCPVHHKVDQCEESFNELDETKLRNWVNSIEPHRSDCHSMQ